MNRKTAFGSLCLGLLLVGKAQATELVYTPVNPSFGGNPLNGSWLLGSAQAQNDTKDPDADLGSASSLSALDRFTSQLQSRLLSQLLTDIGDGNTGSLTTDEFIVNILDDAGNLTVQVTDRVTGEVSEVVINGLNEIN